MQPLKSRKINQTVSCPHIHDITLDSKSIYDKVFSLTTRKIIIHLLILKEASYKILTHLFRSNRNRNRNIEDREYSIIMVTNYWQSWPSPQFQLKDIYQMYI